MKYYIIEDTKIIKICDSYEEATKYLDEIEEKRAQFHELNIIEGRLLI